MSFAIRPLTLTDIPRLAEIRPGFIAHTVLKVEKVGQQPFTSWHLQEVPLPTPFDKGDKYDFDPYEQENIRQRLQGGNALLQVVEKAGRIVGVLDVEQEDWRNTAWIWNIMLDHDARGQGVGRQLVQNTIQWAKGRGLRAILLETQTNNTPACHFYARMGFKLVGINEFFYTNRDLERDEVALFWAYPLR